MESIKWTQVTSPMRRIETGNFTSTAVVGGKTFYMNYDSHRCTSKYFEVIDGVRTRVPYEYIQSLHEQAQGK